MLSGASFDPKKVGSGGIGPAAKELQVEISTTTMQDLFDAEDQEKELSQQSAEEFLLLLGPLVDINLRDAEGALNLGMVGSARGIRNFESFVQYLLAQVSTNDKHAATNPYRQLLSQGRYRPLLEFLYHQIVSSHPLPRLTSEEWQTLVKKFQGELIKISGEDFARNYFHTETGRLRLAGILRQQDAFYSTDTRAELLKGIAAVAERVVGEATVEMFIDDDVETGFWNRANWFTTAEGVEKATTGALNILSSGGRVYEGVKARRESFAKGEIAIPAQMGIDKKEFAKIAQIAAKQKTDFDSLSQLRAGLADLWLMAADEKNWEGHIERGQVMAIRQYILDEVGNLIRTANNIKTEEGFAAFNERIQRFLYDSRYLDGTFNSWLQHVAFDTSLVSALENLMEPVRQPFDHLKQLSDEIHHAADMGSTIFTTASAKNLKDEQLKGHADNLIGALQQTKLRLWHGYKQHKSLSRALSQAGKFLKVGSDITDIESACRAIDRLIVKLAECSSPEEVEEVVSEISDLLGPNGALLKALQAAEMEWAEQSLGLHPDLVRRAVVDAQRAGAP
ncbi:MAG: hypothetical protein Q7S68_05525, partial [Deltaproteobacteria bacterium]|nr:hypothetical protein [Deltaproteobacteria bacterium]